MVALTPNLVLNYKVKQKRIILWCREIPGSRV